MLRLLMPLTSAPSCPCEQGNRRPRAPLGPMRHVLRHLQAALVLAAAALHLSLPTPASATYLPDPAHTGHTGLVGHYATVATVPGFTKAGSGL